MKTIILIILCIASSVNASSIKPAIVNAEVYGLDFKVIKSRLVCPKDNQGYSCKALGSIITVEAEFISCIDQIKSFDLVSYQYGDELIIDIESLALKHPLADEVICKEKKKFIKEIHVVNEFFETVKINNIFSQYRN